MTKPPSPPPGTPLSDDDLDRLSDFLDSVPHDEAMTLEELDGFFCALVIGPEVVMPREYLPHVLGGEPGNSSAFKTIEEAQAILELLMRYWNSIAMAFHDRGAYAPLFDDPDEKNVLGRQWARGFMQGVHLRVDGWRELIIDDDHAGLAMIALTAGEMDPSWPKRKLSAKKRDDLALLMAAGAARAHAHFLKQRASLAPPPAPEPVRRASPKTGRNDPCPCGSGKKFKKCCGDGPTTH